MESASRASPLQASPMCCARDWTRRMIHYKTILRDASCNLKGRNVVSVEGLDAWEILAILCAAREFKEHLEYGGPPLETFKGRVVATVFFEASTRTRCSFESAALRLGASVMSNPHMQASSSVQKGETLQDTMRMFASYADVVVMRHPTRGSCASVAIEECGFGGSARSVLVSGGDGNGEHPTQALLDLYTIAEHSSEWMAGAVDALASAKSCAFEELMYKLSPPTVAFAGDVLNGRTIHSLAPLLARLGFRLLFVAAHGLLAPMELIEALKKTFQRQGLPPKTFCTEAASLEEVLPICDFLYVTRVQKERLADKALEGESIRVTAELLRKHAKPTLKVLHPLPRVDELAPCVDGTPHALYFQQASNGVYVRMALLALLMGGHPFRCFSVE